MLNSLKSCYYFDTKRVLTIAIFRNDKHKNYSIFFFIIVNISRKKVFKMSVGATRRLLDRWNFYDNKKGILWLFHFWVWRNGERGSDTRAMSRFLLGTILSSTGRGEFASLRVHPRTSFLLKR